MRFPKTRPLIVTALLIVLAFLAGRAWNSSDSQDAGAGASAPSAEPTIWTCSMHPQVRLPEPGQCPICFMDLIPATTGDEDDEGPRILQMSKGAMALAEIETAPVEKRSVAHEVAMVGKVALDETRLAYITSWVPGRLDRLFVDYTGVTVRANDHLVEIYSPTLYSAQQELLQAISTAKKLERSSLDVLRNTSDQTVVSSREKLRLYGLSDEQIQEIVERGRPNEHVTIQAPIGGVVVHKNALEGMYVDEGTQIYTIADLSKVWVLLDAYESDLAWLRYGQDVEFSVEAYPGETFHGRVAFIDPLLDDRTRTVKVRLNVDNADQRLKPDMFVSATAHAVLTAHGKVVDENLAGKWMCPMHPEVIADTEEDCSECGMELVPAGELGFVTQPDNGESLVIPHTAPLVTGKRGVVYVRLSDREKPTFEGREIALGPRAGDWYVVHEGLREGEEVVTKGNFKIDSELQIRARPSMMSPESGRGPSGHDHGGAAAVSADLVPVDSPAEFRGQLGNVVDAYLHLQHAFSIDEDSQAMAQAILESLKRVDMGLLEGPAHMAWMEHLAGLEEAADGLVDAADLETRRAHLSPMSNHLVRTLKVFGYERSEGEVGVFHCPMALDGEGAHWLQAGEETANPYYGSSMLRCGSRTEVLPEGVAADTNEDSSAFTDPEPVDSPAVFRSQLGDVVDAYLRLQHAFSIDEDSQAMAQGIVEALERVDMTLLEGSAHVVWMKHVAGLQEAAKNLASAADLESRRASLSPVTDRLVLALKVFGYERSEGEVAVFHCPMALDGQGADWLQEGAETANPYYGSSMLRCGSQTEVLKQEK